MGHKFYGNIMKHSTFNISFYCRESKFRAAINSKRGNSIKDYLDTVRERLDNIITEMMEQWILLTVQTLRGYFQYGGVKFMIETLLDEYLETVHKNDGGNSSRKCSLRVL